MYILKHYIKIIYLFIILSLVCNQGYAGNEKNRHLVFGGGWTYLGLRDQGLSSLYYDGGHAYINAGYLNRVEDKTNSVNFSFLTGKITPAINPELTASEMKIIGAEINVSQMRSAGTLINGKGFFLIGGSSETVLTNYEHNQFTNSSLTNLFFSTLNLSSSLSYPFIRDEQKYLLEFQMHLPLVAFIIRPSYAYIKPAGFEEHTTGNLQSLINSIEVSTFNVFSRISSQLSLEYPLKNNNALRIEYRWKYFSHHNDNPIKSASHGIIVQTMFNF